MQNLFDLMPEVQLGVHHFPAWRYVRAGLQRNLETVLRYYRQNPTAVRGGHLLKQVLGAVDVPLSHPTERYYDLVDARAFNVAKASKITSSVSYGKSHDGVFYGPGNTELLVLNNDSFDPLAAHANWQNLAPIQVLRHPMSDLGLPILDGVRNYGSEEGLAVITINITLLAVQYRAFRLAEDLIQAQSEDSERSVMQFLRMYVLPNMLASHLDVAVFNRISNLAFGAPLGESTYRHPFAMPDYAAKCDAVLQDELVALGAQGQNWTGILRTILAVTKENMDEVMRLPQIAPTRQVLWALVAARTNALAFIFRTSRNGAATTNAQEVNRLRRAVRAYQSDKTLENQVPADVYWEIQSEIDGILGKPTGSP